MKRNLICFSASGDNSRTGLNCAGTEEELDESGDNGMDETTMKVLVAVRTIMLTMIMAVKLSKQSGYISSKSVTTCYQNEL